MKKELQPLIKPKHKNTIHKDGTVSFWCIFDNVWKRLPFDKVSVKNLASFSFEERSTIFGKLLKK